MANPIIPPSYVNIPSRVIYSPDIRPAVRDTYCQLRGLAWSDPGRSETKPLSLQWLENTLGKSRTTLYGHLAELRDGGWLQFIPTQTGMIIVRFSDPLEQSENPDMTHIKDPLDQVNSINGDLINTVRKTGQVVRKFGKKKDRLRDPLLDNPAVKKYREICKFTPNEEQRKIIAEAVEAIPEWEHTLTHWLGHGWSPKNVVGMVDSYKVGGKKCCRFCNKANPGKVSNFDETKKAMERVLRECNNGES